MAGWAIASGQTQVRLSDQVRKDQADFSNATLTKPIRAGASLPGTCTQAEVFWKTDATPGENVYLCTSTDVWVKAAVNVLAGAGVVTTGAIVAVDDTTVPGYSTGAGVPTASCMVGRDFYVNTATTALYYCSATDTWSVASSGGGSGSVTSDVISRPNTRRWAYWAANGSTTTLYPVGDIATSGGTVTATAGVATSTQPASLNLATAASVNTTAFEAGNQNYLLSASPRLQTYVTIPASSDYVNARYFIVMQDGTTSSTQLGSDTPVAKFFGFRASTASDTNWRCIHGGTANFDTADSGVAIDTTGHKFEAYYDNTNSRVLYYIDGTQVCSSVTTTYLPVNTGIYRYLIGGMTTEAVAKNLRIAWVYVESDR